MTDNTPPERDVKDFEFIQLCKFRVSDADQEIPTERGKLLACSSQYGLVVYAIKQGFSVVRTADLLAIDQATGKERNKLVVEDIPVLASVSVGSPVLFMDISSDGLLLAVVVGDQSKLNIMFYDVRMFADKGTSHAPFAKSQVHASPSSSVSDLSWNPAVPTMLAVCMSDGSVELVDVTGSPKVMAVLAVTAGATCFCWSPKGKQLLVGRRDGTLAQYDHGLVEKKVWPCPSLLAGPHRVVDVVWQSTYVFLAAYLPAQAQPSDQPIVIMSSSNKENKTTYINFEDVCFGNGEDRKPQYFFHLVQKWDVILIASSNATETTIVGRNLDDKVSWEHWNLEDCSRAELPLTSQQGDSFPTGLVVDYSPHKDIVISESKVLPPCPVMYLLSTDGMLVSYHLYYSHKEAGQATTPPLPLTVDGARKGVAELAGTSGVVQPPSVKPSLLTPAPSSSSVVTAPPPLLPPVVTAPPSLLPSVVAAPMPSTTTSSPLTTPATSQLPFASFTSPATAAPSFQFGGMASKLGAFSGGQSNQKQQQPHPPTTATSQPPLFSFGSHSFGASTFTFGAAATTTTSSAPGVNSFFSTGSSKPFSQPSSAIFGSGTATVTLTQPGITATPSTFGQVQTTQPSKVEGLSSSQLGPQPAFTSKPAPTNHSPQSTQAAQAAGNGLVLGSSYKSVASPALDVRSKSIEATVDSAFTQNILEEIADFERELSELRARSRRQVKAVGTKEELQVLRQNKEKMINFVTEINKVTKEQLSEVQEQKANCFNLLAMLEECQSRHKRDLDPHYHSLLLGRMLDPASAERLKSLQQMSQAIEQSIIEVDHTLDAQWQEHLARKKKEERLYTPAGETIYKTIRNNHIVISSQRQQLEKLEEQLRSLRMYNRLSGSLVSGDGVQHVKTPEKKEMSLPSAATNSLSPERVTKLREMLSQRKVPRVKSTAPDNLSMSRIVSLTPGRSPVATSITTPTQQQQETPHRPQQQRKHQLNNQFQNVSNQPTFQQGQPQINQSQPLKLQQVNVSTKPSAVPDGVQRLTSGGPTSFSGTAYFKQHAADVNKTQTSVTQTGVAPLAITKVGGGQALGGAAIGAPGTNLLSVPNLVVSGHVAMGNVSSTPKTSGVPRLPAQQYESITPTETEDDDDDYDEEDNGYEDEEEEEEDEEETGFEGLKSNLTQMLGPQTSRGGQAIVSSFGGSAGSTGVFKLSQSAGPNELNIQAFVPLKSTAQTSAPPVSPSPVITTTTPGFKKDLFGTKSATDPVFGGAAILGDKSGPNPSSTGQEMVFGSLATPSRSVAFRDFTDRVAPVAGRDGQGGEPVAGRDDQGREPVGLEGNKPVTTTVFGNTTTTTSTLASATTTPSLSSTVSSVFGGKSTSQGSVFGFSTTAASSASAANKSLLFGATAATIPAAMIDNPPSSVVTEKTNSVTNPPEESPAKETFSGVSSPRSQVWGVATSQDAGHVSPTTTSTTPSAGPAVTPVFGSVSSSSSDPTKPTASSIFGGGSSVATSTSVFGSPAGVVTTSPPAYGADTLSSPASSHFGAQTVPTTTDLGSPFGAKTSSIFDGGAPNASLFGASSATTTAAQLFGSSSTTTAAPLFGSLSAPSTAAPLFGSSSTTTAAPLFGSLSATSTAAPLFGSGSTTTAAPLFGSSSTTTAAPLFGSSSTTTAAPLFGSSSTTTAAPLFGSSSSTSVFGTSTTSTSAFGGATTQVSSPFGGAATTQASSPFSGAGSIVFGDTSTSKSISLFPSTVTSSSAPTFGMGTAAASAAGSSAGGFGGGALFGSSNTTSATTGVFGAGPSSTSAFSAPSQSGSIFGQATTSTGFGFGQSSSSGGQTLFGQTSAFGQQPPSSTSCSLFGFGGLGGKPSEEKAKLNVFGSPQVFGSSTTQTSNLFGSGGSTSFGSGDTSSFSGSGTGRFSAGAGGVATSGFGVTVSQPTSGGFGAAPAFGSAPSFASATPFGSKIGGFGASPAFGGSPAFGSSPAFSNPAGSSPAFGAGSAGSGFSSFANVAAPTFGQLAQSSPSASTFGSSGGGFGSPSQTQPSVFGSGFGATQNTFGGGSLFGQGAASPGFGGGQQAPAFGNSSTFGSNPAFSSYRG